MHKGTGYVNIDALQAQISLEAAAAKCGVQLDVKKNGKEARMDCPFQCPGEHAGRREVSINTDNPQKVFCCHSYGCQVRGNLLTLMHGWVTGQRPTGDKLKGEEFNRIKQLLSSDQSVAPQRATAPNPPQASATPEERLRNTPLEDASDERVRELATLDTKLIRDVGALHPAAAAYCRRHPTLTPESMLKWRCGYLPLDGGSDKRGWSLRGQIVYPLLSEEGKTLAWIGRDPAFEEKERAFASTPESQRAALTAPIKHRFPKGCQRGLELFGQQASRLKEPGYREFIAEYGVLVVEGFNDVIGLDALGIPAVGLMSNRMTEFQAEKIRRFAAQLAGGKVLLMLDCDPAGDEGAKECLWMLAQQQLNVQLVWSQAMHSGTFRGMQPEQLSRTDWEAKLRGALRQ